MIFPLQKSEPQTASEYVAELSRLLRRSMPADRAEQISCEAYAHLSDRIEELTEQGVPPAIAQSVALAGFGPVRTYARAAAVNTYGDRHNARWRLAGRIAAALFLVFVVQAAVLRLESSLPQPGQTLLVGGALLCPLVLAVSSVRSRLPQTRTLLTFTAVAFLTLFAGAGLMYVPNADTPTVLVGQLNSPTETLKGGPGLRRIQNQRWIDGKIQDGQFVRHETALLAQGVTVYRLGQPVPTSLMQEGRYIVPRTGGLAWYRNGSHASSDTSAFKDLDLYTDRLGDEEARLNTLPYQTVSTRPEAAQAWAERGQSWLDGKRQRIAFQDGEIATIRRATTAPLGFNTGAATYHASLLLWLCLPLVALDYLMAHLGRALWIVARNRGKGQRRSA